MNYIPTTLAIDTSCDETSVSVVRGTTVLSNVLPSQMEYHQKYGGVVPSLARLAHEERIANVVEESMKRAKVGFADIDTISVTIGPGLAIALEVGIKKAKELAEKYSKPLITINHMEGHLLSALAKPKNNRLKITDFELKAKFPVLGFLISGGHTELVLVKVFGEYKIIGETLDDSCGEAYDKCGRILGLGYPAGPTISEFSKRHRKNIKLEYIKDNKSRVVKAINKSTGSVYELPVAMATSGDLNMSFSGLKTAFKQLVDKKSDEIKKDEKIFEEAQGLSKEEIYDLCVVFEAAALRQLEIKLERAINDYKPKEVWLGGGVVASARLRSQLRKVCRRYNIKMRYPYSSKLTTDNAAMIGVAANIRIAKKGAQFSTLSTDSYGSMKWALNIHHCPEKGIYLKDFDLIDRDPTLSL